MQQMTSISFYRVYFHCNIDHVQTNFLTYLHINRTPQIYVSSFLILNFDPSHNGMVDLSKKITKIPLFTVVIYMAKGLSTVGQFKDQIKL